MNQLGRIPNLINANQAVTGSWVNVGGPIDCLSFNSIAAWLKYTMAGGAANLRIRALGKLIKDSADTYTLPIQTINSTLINVNDEYYEFDTDTAGDYKSILEIYTAGLIPWVQLQISAGTPGTAVLTSCDVTLTDSSK